MGKWKRLRVYFLLKIAILSIDTPPKTNTDPPKKRFLIGISFSRGPFSVAMLVLEGCKC